MYKTTMWREHMEKEDEEEECDRLIKRGMRTEGTDLDRRPTRTQHIHILVITSNSDMRNVGASAGFWQKGETDY